MRSVVVTLVLVLFPAVAQEMHFGLKAGVPATSYFDTHAPDYSSATRRYVVGVAAEVFIARGIATELDALYRRIGYAGLITSFPRPFNGNFTQYSVNTSGGSWDFPLLAKLRFGHKVRPFAGAGGVLRYIGPVHATGLHTDASLITRTGTTTSYETSNPSDLNKRAYLGVAAAGGLEFSIGRTRFTPEVRYTRWTSNISSESGLIRFTPNQIDVLLGVGF